MSNKRFRVLVIIDNEPKHIVADHDLVPVHFSGVKGFISQSLYDVLSAKETEMRQALARFGIVPDDNEVFRISDEDMVDS